MESCFGRGGARANGGPLVSNTAEIHWVDSDTNLVRLISEFFAEEGFTIRRIFL